MPNTGNPSSTHSYAENLALYMDFKPGTTLLGAPTELREMTLTAQQARALTKIIPKRFPAEHREKLARVIRMELQTIREAREAESSTKGRPGKKASVYYSALQRLSRYGVPTEISASLLKDVKRSTSSAETMAETLHRQHKKLKSYWYPDLPIPPIKELLRYAQEMKAAAAEISKEIKRSRSTRKKREPRKSSEAIVELALFVHDVAGTWHWVPLTKLIKAAIADDDYTQDSLRKLVRYHQDKKRRKKAAEPKIPVGVWLPLPGRSEKSQSLLGMVIPPVEN